MYSGHSCRDCINFCGLLVGDLLLDITNEASNRIGIPGFPSPATSSDANEAASYHESWLISSFVSTKQTGPPPDRASPRMCALAFLEISCGSGKLTQENRTPTNPRAAPQRLC